MSPPCLSEEQAAMLDDAGKQSNTDYAHVGRRRHHVDEMAVQLCSPLSDCFIYGIDGHSHHPLGAGRSYGTLC